MDLQALDKSFDPQSTDEYTQLETSQYSQNAIPNPITDVSFSSITNNADSLPYNIQGLFGTQQDSPSFFDFDGKIDAMIKDMELGFGDMPCDDLIDSFTKQLDMMELEAIDQSIQDRQMSVKVQPPTDIRRRYETDGKRQIERSRSKPMAIELPNLTNCKSDLQSSFWLQLYLLTTDENPSQTVYIHSDKLEYHADDALQSDNGSVRIPITPEEIQEGVKQLARISIVKKKLDSYTFKLIPFASLLTNPTETIYENKSANSVVAKAKCFRENYHLISSRIACRLVIKQNDIWHTTNIVCETEVMEEKKQTDDKKPPKRSACQSDEYPVHQQSSIKKPKASIGVLPVIRVKQS